MSRHFNLPHHYDRYDMKVHILHSIYALLDSKFTAIMREKTEFNWIHNSHIQLPMDKIIMDKNTARVSFTIFKKRTFGKGKVN